MHRHRIPPTLGCVAIAAVCFTHASLAQEIDFAHDVAPILKRSCGECHTRGAAKGELSLNTRQSLLESKAVLPGNAEESPLIQRIRSSDPDTKMPPGDRPPLSDQQVATIARWIDAGAPWTSGFTFAGDGYDPPVALKPVEPPPFREDRPHALDRLLDAYVASVPGGQPAGAARRLSDSEFLRRVSLDLIGLPPTEGELDAFLKDDSPDKRAAVVDALLDRDRAYAEHWLSFWNDLLRNAYAGAGYIDGGRKQITGWLYRSLLENKPFDAFANELIAPGDAASGFVKGIKWRGAVNASQVRELQFSQNISQVFLGINMKCASCHNSFVDRWTLKDAYGLAAIVSERPLEIHRCDQPTGEKAEPAWIYPELGGIDAQAAPEERLKQLAMLVTDPRNGRFSRTIVNRLWAKLMGRGVVHPVDAMQTRPWSESVLDYLASELIRDAYDLKKTLRRIVLSEYYQQRAVASRQEELESSDFVFRGPIAKRMTAEQFLDSVRQVVGVWPAPAGGDYKVDGRGQGGQLRAVLDVHGQGATWGDRPLRASLRSRDPLQAALGRPNRAQVVSERPPLLSTLEAIELANGSGLAELLSQGAEALLHEQESSDALLETIYRRALSRSPSEDERRVAREILGDTPSQAAVEDLLWVVFMLPEFQFNR